MYDQSWDNHKPQVQSVLAGNDHRDRITGDCDEQHLEYWCIPHVQEARTRSAKMESNNVTILDLPPSSSIGTSRSFRPSS